MKLIVCARDLDRTKVKGDLLAWFDDDFSLGKKEGVINAVTKSSIDKDDYLQRTPFIILTLPLVLLSDIEPIIKEMKFEYPNKGYLGSPRKWKINFDSLELRDPDSKYAIDDTSETKLRYEVIEDGLVSRATLTNYNEITRNDITINDIKVLR